MHRFAVPLFLAAATAAAATPAPTPKVAVFDLQATNVDPALADSLAELLTEQLARAGRATVISRAEVVSLLGFERKREALACDDDASCASEIAGALGVDRLVTGAVGKVGGTFLLTLRIIDVRAARVTARTSDTVSGAADELVAAMRRAVPVLVAQDELLRPARSNVAGPVLVAGGGALLVAGAIVGVLQRGNVAALSDRFAREGTYDEAKAATARTQATAANALLVGGAVVAAAGVGVWLW